MTLRHVLARAAALAAILAAPVSAQAAIAYTPGSGAQLGAIACESGASQCTKQVQRDSGDGDATDPVNHGVRSSPINIVFTGTTTALTTGSATFAGAQCTTGVAPGSASPFAYYSAYFLMDQAGTAEIDGSNDGTTWFAETSSSAGAVTASTPLILTVTVMFRYQRAKLTLTGGSNATVTVVNASCTGA